MTDEMDEEHLQFLSRNFQDNLQEAMNSQTDMFLTSVGDYLRYCNFGARNMGNCSNNEEGCARATSEDMYRLKQELSLVKAQLENARALISQLESAPTLISILRSALKTSQAVTEKFLNEH